MPTRRSPARTPTASRYDLGGMTDARRAATVTPRDRRDLGLGADRSTRSTTPSSLPRHRRRSAASRARSGPSDPCASARAHRQRRRRSSAPTSRRTSAFTVRLTWPDTVVAVSAHELAARPRRRRSTRCSPGSPIAFVGWRYRRRWRSCSPTAQTQLWATFGPDVAGPQTEAYDLTGEPAIEFVPPMGLRPGEVGALVEVGTTRAAHRDRRRPRGPRRDQDHRVLRVVDARAPQPRRRRSTDDEQMVMTGLFGDADTTTLDDRGTEMGDARRRAAPSTSPTTSRHRGPRGPGTGAGGLHAEHAPGVAPRARDRAVIAGRGRCT